MSTISSPGIGSGIDVQTIVSQLVALERAPVKTLQTQASSLQTRLSVFGTIRSQFSALADAAAKLGNVSNWQAMAATSSNPSAVGITTQVGAQASALTLEVQQLAKAQSAASSSIPTSSGIGPGTLSIEVGTGAPVEVVINPGEDSLSAVAAKINEAGAGVSATVLRDASGERLLMRSTATGEDNTFTVSVTSGDGGGIERLAFGPGVAGGMAQTQAAQNAMATVNNVTIVSQSNLLDDSLPGLALTLNQVTTAPVEINVTPDQEAIKKNIQGFIDAYNAISSTLSSSTRFDEASKTAGPLQGDSTATGLQNALRGMMRSVTNSTPFSRLTDIGLSMQTNGALSVDNTKLNAALSDRAGIKALFTNDTGSATELGFGLKVKSFADGLLAADGLVSNKAKSIQSAIDRNDKAQNRVNDRANRAEVRLLAQYNALDANMGRLSGLSAFVSQQVTLWNKSSG